MSNYLRSPLHSVVGFSQAMLQGLSGEINDKQTKYIQIINSNSSELLLFIEKLVELSQVESDLYNVEYNNFDAAALLSVIIEEANVKVENKDIKINLNTSELITQNCYSDKNVLKMVVNNLIENAISSIETGEININISNPVPEFLLTKGIEINENSNSKSYLLFEVMAKGMDPKQYNSAEIFDPYVQIDKNSKKFLLQSLLLSSSKKYINKLKGDIWVNTKYANQVSFVFFVPVEKSVIEQNSAG